MLSSKAFHNIAVAISFISLVGFESFPDRRGDLLKSILLDFSKSAKEFCFAVFSQRFIPGWIEHSWARSHRISVVYIFLKN